MMEDMICFHNVPRLEEELESHIRGTYSAANLLTLLEGEDPEVLEEAFATMQRCETALDISALPIVEPTGADALRLKQEAEFNTVEQITVGLEGNDPLILYLQELEQLPVAGDVQAYAESYLQGQHHLAESIMNLCLRLVLDMALEFTGHGVLLMDLIQEGNLAVWDCLQEYEGGDFRVFAQWHIRQNMAKAVTVQAFNSGVGKLIREDMERYLEEDRRLLMQLGRNPTRSELAQALGMEESDVQAFEKMIEDARSQAQVTEQTKEPEPTPEDEQAVEDTAYFQMRQRITELLSTLTEQESKLLRMRFGLDGGKPMTPEQTGVQLGMTPAEVVAAEAAALAKLRTEA